MPLAFAANALTHAVHKEFSITATLK